MLEASHTNLAKEPVIHALITSIFSPHFSPDLSQGPRFVSVTGKLGVPDPSSIQSELDRWFQVLRSPRRKELVVPLH